MTGRRARGLGSAAVGLVLLAGCGQPEPEVVTRTVEVEVVPQACLDAIEHGYATIEAMSEAVDVYADNTRSVTEGTTVEEYLTQSQERTEVLEEIGGRLATDAFVEAANSCAAAAD